MLLNRKKRLLCLGLLTGAYLLLFVLHYEISLFVESDIAVEMVSYFVYLAVATLTAAAAVIFMGLYREMGARAHLWLLYLTLARLAYQIPYYYIYYIIKDSVCQAVRHNKNLPVGEPFDSPFLA